MKKIIATTRKEDLHKVASVLKDIIYFPEKEGDLVRISIYVRDGELDNLIDKLENTIDLRYKKSMIEVYTPDFVISPVLNRSEEEGSEEKASVEKLIHSTKTYLKLDISEIALTSIAGMVALTGLFVNNVAIIIGAMLLSPILGPIHAFAINTAVGKVKNAVRSIVNLSILIMMVIFFSFLATVSISYFAELSLTPEILARMDSSFIYTLMALFLGFASIFALSKEIPEGIAGVAIAAALLPPAVVTGISLVLYPSEFVNPLILTFENVLGLMAGSLLATLLLDIGPRRYYKRVVARKSIIRASLILIALLILLYVFSLFLS